MCACICVLINVCVCVDMLVVVNARLVSESIMRHVTHVTDDTCVGKRSLDMDVDMMSMWCLAFMHGGEMGLLNPLITV